MVAYTVVWLRLFSPLSGHGLLLYGLGNLATLVLFGSFGLLVGKRRKQPWLGAAVGTATGLLVLAIPAFYLYRGLSALAAVLGI